MPAKYVKSTYQIDAERAHGHMDAVRQVHPRSLYSRFTRFVNRQSPAQLTELIAGALGLQACSDTPLPDIVSRTYSHWSVSNNCPALGVDLTANRSPLLRWMSAISFKLITTIRGHDPTHALTPHPTAHRKLVLQNCTMS